MKHLKSTHKNPELLPTGQCWKIRFLKALPSQLWNLKPVSRTSLTEQERISAGFINQLELVFSFKRVDTTRIEKMIAMLGNSADWERIGMVQSVPGETRSFPYDLSTWPRFKEKFRATFGEINQEQVSEARLHIEWNDSALRSQFYHGLSSEIKDALVHFDNPSSVSAAMDMAIRIDNRFLKDVRNKDYFIRDPHPVILQQLHHFSI
ncbi:hypothetical protein BASA62_007047 [Batrachochytrium salamandrivorans]|nr:hypothetical protein BASA62_007047 [Batrachochytrium salamandrivorans]